jgi:hypothetical protein
MNLSKITLRIIITFISVFVLKTGVVCGQELIPKPVQMDTTYDGTFILNSNTKIVVASDWIQEAQLLGELIKVSTGIEMVLETANSHSSSAGNIVLLRDRELEEKEAYRLQVREGAARAC